MEEAKESNNYNFAHKYKSSLSLTHNELGTSARRKARIQHSEITIQGRLNPEAQRAYSLMRETESNPDTITGLGLNWGETKALCAVQRLLDNTDHLGHAQTRVVEGQLGKFKLPVLFVKITDYLSAYELEKNANNRFNNNQRAEAIKNIESLEKQRQIFFEKSYWQPAKGKNKSEKKGEWISNFVEIKAQLIAVKKMYSKPSKSSTKQEEDNQKKKRYTHLQIICSPLLFYKINKEYLLKPEGLFRAIEDASKKANNKAKKSSYNLIILLLQTDLPEISYFRDTLIEVLELSGFKQRRQQKLIDVAIEEAISIATELGFLLSSTYDPHSDKFSFNPNPKHSSRLERKLTSSTTKPVKLSELIDEQMEWQLLHSFMF